ncbi:hypothetical protein TNCT_358291, partial [Trichonephila clavata]
MFPTTSICSQTSPILSFKDEQSSLTVSIHHIGLLLEQHSLAEKISFEKLQSFIW